MIIKITQLQIVYGKFEFQNVEIIKYQTNKENNLIVRKKN